MKRIVPLYKNNSNLHAGRPVIIGSIQILQKDALFYKFK